MRELIRTMEAAGVDATGLKQGLLALEADDRKSGNTGSTSNGTSNLESGVKCLSGSWTREICGGGGTASVSFSGGSSGSGSFEDMDCTKQCPRVFPFTYQVLSDSSMTIEYGMGQICGEPKQPKGGTQAWSCSAGILQFGNTYTRSR